METVTLTKKDLQELMRDMLSQQRQDIRKQICSADEARQILDLGLTAFYELLKDPECKIKPSKLRGKYVLQSVYKEADRLNGN